MKITISDQIKSITPNFHVGVISAEVEVYEEPRINSIISDIEERIMRTIDIKDVVNLDVIKQARDAYKAYGKDPSRYRLATESLLRRLSKGNKLYRINNVVDLGNILSINTRKSIAVLDYDKIEGDVLIRLGTSDDEYYGIGRGKLNVENIPLYEDLQSAFGSSTSDTERTMITENTKKILLFIISFSNTENISNELEYAKGLYLKYANATNIESYIL